MSAGGGEIKPLANAAVGREDIHLAFAVSMKSLFVR